MNFNLISTTELAIWFAITYTALTIVEAIAKTIVKSVKSAVYNAKRVHGLFVPRKRITGPRKFKIANNVWRYRTSSRIKKPIDRYDPSSY
jgi:hypothetical protein